MDGGIIGWNTLECHSALRGLFAEYSRGVLSDASAVF